MFISQNSILVPKDGKSGKRAFPCSFLTESIQAPSMRGFPVVTIPVVPFSVGIDVSAILLPEPVPSVVWLTLIPVCEPWSSACAVQLHFIQCPFPNRFQFGSEKKSYKIL